MVHLCGPFLPLNGETGKQLGAKWVKTASPVTVLPAPSAPSVDIKTAIPMCLSSTGSRLTTHRTAAVSHPHLMTFVISIPLQTVYSLSLAGEESRSREQSLSFTLVYWFSVCSGCGRDSVPTLSQCSTFLLALFRVWAKPDCQMVKLAFW